MLREQVFIDAGLVIEAFEVAGGDKLDEVFVAFLRFAEQDEMIVAVGIGAGLVALLGDVDFAADDGMNAFFRRFVIKLDSAEEVAVIGHGDRGHLLAFHDLDELLDIASAIEEGVIGVAMEVNERAFGHAGQFIV